MTTQRLSTPPSEARNRPVTPWWVDAVIYQVYPRSFADADGDGMGDLRGVTSRLDYLAQLGVDAIWLSPFYLSPQHDAGYDVADYRAVDPRFGTLADADEMIAAAHEAGIRVVVDLVPNHTSSEHAWFQAALAAGPGSPERARYHFAEGRGEHGELPPNNWESTFGGGAWTRVTEADGTPGQWYLHLFDTTQPDLNWENEEVREEFRSILRFWLDRGVDGFRVDVAHGLIKQPGYPDAEHSRMGMVTDAGEDADPTFDPDTFEPLTPFMDQDRVHEVYRDWRRVLDSYDHEPMMVAEAWVAPLSRMFRYVRPGEMHQTFNFTYLMAGWDAASLTHAIDRSFEQAGRVGVEGSVFELYRRLLQIRGELDLGTGTFAWSEHHDPARGVLAFTVTSGGGRHLGSGEPIPARTVLVMANLSTDPVDLPAGHSRALFSLEEAEAVQDGQLAHDAAAWLLMD